MTHVLDLTEDLYALVGPLEQTTDDPGTGATEPSQDERPPLVRPLAGLTTPVWYL